MDFESIELRKPKPKVLHSKEIFPVPDDDEFVELHNSQCDTAGQMEPGEIFANAQTGVNVYSVKSCGMCRNDRAKTGGVGTT
jgi:hypothetical protein